VALGPGIRLGPYEVLSILGVGGMGQVYRARDTRLGRDVALKLMSEAANGDAPMLSRFEQEARLAGSLNHPNVLVVFDVGRHDGAPYLVTELLHGETLRHRTGKGPIPLDTALDWAAQVARGLAAAHAQGVIHRDVKPENVFLTRAGHVKLLDFGIAKLTETPRGPWVNQVLDSTATGSEVTVEGQVVGTPSYMSPEQVRGEPVDARTDLFSLGAVLYEMVSGQRAFRGSTPVEIKYAILHTEPAALSARLPLAVTQLIRHCLEKDRDKRFQSATDLAFHLDAMRTPSGSILASQPSARRFPWRWLWPLVPLALAVGVVLAIRNHPAPRPQEPPSIRRLTFRTGMVTSARFAPDARTVLFSASWNGERERLYSTTTSNPDYNPVGVDDARLAAVSPSGELAVLLHPRTSRAGLSSVAGTLAVLPGVGGAPRELADGVTGADWTPDGTRMAITRQTSDRYRLEFPIGTVVYESQAPILLARVSPDGRTLVFVERQRTDDAKGSLVLLEPGKERRVLLHGWEELTAVAWTARGDELWFSGLRIGVLEHPSLWAVSLTGQVRPLHPATSDLRLEDVGRDGRMLAREGQSAGDLATLNVSNGKVERHLGWFDAPRVAGVSADGSALLVDESGDAATTFGVTSGGGMSWAFLQQTSGAPAIRLGPGAPRALSSDGRTALVFDNENPGRIWLLPTGVGLRRFVDFSGLSFVPWWSSFLPGAIRAVVPAEGMDGVRGHVVDFKSGQSRALTPPVRRWGPVSPDGRFLAAVPVDGKPMAFPTEAGSAARPLQGVKEDEALIAWTQRGLLVSPDLPPGIPARPPIRLFRVDPDSGRRQLLVTIGPGEAPGADIIPSIVATADGQTIAYSYFHATNRLFLFDFHLSASTPPPAQ
jgi:eukaryotic-like serine/threonine-protein kinase